MPDHSKFWAILILQWSLSLIIMSALSAYLGFQSIVIGAHMVLVSVFIALQYTFLGLLLNNATFRTARWAPLAVGLYCATPLFLLLMLYMVNTITNALGSHNVTFAVVVNLLPELDKLVRLLPITLTQLIAGYVILFLALLGFYTKLSSIIIGSLHPLFQLGGPHSLLRTPAKSFGLAAAALVLLLASIVPVASRFEKDHKDIWQWEPLVSLFIFFDYFADGTHKQKIAAQDTEARQTYPTDQKFDRRNVIVIVSDSLRADRMSVYGYPRKNTPFLNELYQSGNLRKVDMALSTCPESACGVMSILTSRNFRALSTYNFKLNELLWDQGYPVYFLLSGDQTYYDGLRWYFGNSITSYFDGNQSTRYAMNDDRLLMEGLESVPDFNGEASFFYFHMMGTHYLGEKLDRYQRYQPAEIETGWHAFKNADDEVRSNRYDNGVLQADDIIAQLFGALDNKGYLEESLIIILGDHGEGLGERGNYGHDDFVYQEDIRIPLLILDTKDAHYQNLAFASQLDVAPTLIDRLGLSIPEVWQGQSLLSKNTQCCTLHQTRYKPIHAMVIREPGKIYKYMRWSDQDIQPPREELYELNSDPGERNNLLATAAPALLAKLRQQLAQELGES